MRLIERKVLPKMRASNDQSRVLRKMLSVDQLNIWRFSPSDENIGPAFDKQKRRSTSPALRNREDLVIKL